MLQKIKKTLSSIEFFFQFETIGGLLLFICATGALIWANSRHALLYEQIIHFPISFSLGNYLFKTTVHHIVNEGLMTLFFFVVGLEIKRELRFGEMSSARKASFPLLAAVGGMLVPAAIYYFFNKGLPSETGWGIPMATDIAFAVGILSLMSRKVPFSLKIFLLSLAIIDDIGAVLVMALYYSQELSGPYLALAALVSFALFLKFKMGIRNPIVFGALAISLWICLYHSGVHATLSGILLGFLIPSDTTCSEKQIIGSVKKIFSQETPSLKKVNHLKSMLKGAYSPLHYFLHTFHPYVSFVVMPLFAFVNAGIVFNFTQVQEFVQTPIYQGIFLGLVIGKPLGIVLFAFLGVTLGLVQLPKYVTWKQVIAVGFLAGIGFTMSLFIGNLSFEKLTTAHLQAKVSIVIASTIAGVVGIILLSFMKTVPKLQRKSES